MMRRWSPVATCALALLAGCQQIPAAPDGAPMRDGALTDAGAGDGALDGGLPDCRAVEIAVDTRDLVIFEHPGASAGRGVGWTFTLAEVDGSEAILEIALAGDLEAIEDDRGLVSLGGAQADLATCTHCVLLWPDCRSTPDRCSGDPYVATSGRVFVFHAPQGAERELDLELSDVVLVPARVSPTTLESVLRPADGCVRLARARVAGIVSESDCTFSRFACALAATVDDRE
jgi:hypothetical protein